MAGFVDEAQLCARAGDGGAGCVSFRREAHVSRGGPDGGDGGTGGDVWLVATRNVASLLAFRDHPHRRAENGVHGQGKKKHGAAGADIDVPVPEGTQVKDRDGILLADLAHAGDRWRAVEGGRGGRGNARFLSNRRRAPAFAEQGEPGDEIWFDLELKLLADVALVGFPNVGKSTLIARISAARPKIADYPFTTLEPNLGVVRTDDAEFVVADIPGLIEGASEGKGLGHQFLRHIERARVLVILCDLAPADGVPVAEQQRILLDELGQYQPDLLDRPRLVVGSRADMVTDDAIPEGLDLIISSITGRGIDDLVGRAATLVTGARAAEPVDEEESRGPAFVLHRPGAAPFDIFRDDDGAYVVDGREARRAVALSDLSDVQALEVAHGRLKRLGVDRALARAGAEAGDTVRIGGLAFDYEPES
ncbi:MAG TPA: GTPase ObgE [Acidimicrobiales bacterium]|nr:GTPase ObgE [Acidimicrobiales bacterium]